MSVHLLGLGTATPAGCMGQAASAEFAALRCCRTEAQRAWLHQRYSHSGVDRRYSVLLPAGEQRLPGDADGFFPLPDDGCDQGPGTRRRLQRFEAEAPALAAAACRRALSDAGVEAGSISDLICVSCTGLMSPGVDAALIQGLGLPAKVSRMSLGFMGCHGGLNGLGGALSIGTARPAARVLLCCIELCTLHFTYGFDRQRIVANALFGDGATAMVLGGGGDGDAAGHERCSPWRLVDTASLLLPDSAEAMTWRIGDHGFEMGLSIRIPSLVREHLRPWLETWLDGHGMTLADVQSWNVHPGGPKVLDAAAEALALDGPALHPSRQVLRDCGNMSSATMGFIQQRLTRTGAAGPCVALGFGPGLVFEAALLDRSPP